MATKQVHQKSKSANSAQKQQKQASKPKEGGTKPMSVDYDVPRYLKMGVLTKQGNRVVAPDEWSPELKRIDDLGAGDSFILFNVLPPHLDSTAFETLKNEISWNEMFHRGGAVPRLISIQGTIENGAEPLYRHPADEQPAMIEWTPFASELRRYVSDVLKQEMNHALIQYYRSGNDYISAHADKTLDVKRGSMIVNLSIGATRTMVLKTKTKKPNRSTQRITLPHNSLFVLGWETNRKWTHEIRQDKRMDAIKRPDELDYESNRISLTFRTISTFMRRSDGQIYGQGAVHKTEEELNAYLATNNNNNNNNNNAGSNDDSNKKSEDEKAREEEEDEAVKMIKAFSAENRDSHFDWNKHYGRGFSLLNFKVFVANHDPQHQRTELEHQQPQPQP